MSDQPPHASDHPSWCSPHHCLTATIEPDVGPVILEHVGEPVELATGEARFTLQRILESGTNGSEFIRLRAGLHDEDDPFLIHISASEAEDLAGLLRSVAGQLGGQR